MDEVKILFAIVANKKLPAKQGVKNWNIIAFTNRRTRIIHQYAFLHSFHKPIL